MTKKTWTQIAGLACGLGILAAPGWADDNAALKQLKDVAGPNVSLSAVNEPSSHPVSITGDNADSSAPAQELLPFDTLGWGGQYWPEPPVYAGMMRYWLREISSGLKGVQLNHLESYSHPASDGTYVGMKGFFSVTRPKEPQKGARFGFILKPDPFDDNIRLSDFACEASYYYLTRVLETLAANGLITSYKVDVFPTVICVNIIQ